MSETMNPEDYKVFELWTLNRVGSDSYRPTIACAYLMRVGGKDLWAASCEDGSYDTRLTYPDAKTALENLVKILPLLDGNPPESELRVVHRIPLHLRDSKFSP